MGFHTEVRYLEEPLDLASFHIHIDPSVGRVRAGSRHQADRSGHGAEEFCAGKDQDVTDRQDPALGHSLASGVMSQAQVGLDHHRIEILQGGIGLKPFGFGFGFGRPGDTVGSIDFFGNRFNPLPEAASREDRGI